MTFRILRRGVYRDYSGGPNVLTSVLISEGGEKAGESEKDVRMEAKVRERARD